MCEQCGESMLNTPPTPYRPISPPLSPTLQRPLPPNSLLLFPTIQSQQNNTDNILGQHGLLNQPPIIAQQSIPQSSPVLNQIHPSSHHLYNHHASLNSTPAATQDSPQFSINASPSIDFQTLSLRTPQNRPLPTFLPPAPRTSGPTPSSPTTSTQKPSVSSLRANYSRMIGRKNSISAKGAYKASTTSAAMPPPPAPPVRPMMADFSELESLIQQGEYDPLYVPPCHCFKCEPCGGAGVSLSESTRHESHVPSTSPGLHAQPPAHSRTFSLTGHSSLPAAYVSPDMTMADSAAFIGFGGSASAAQSTSSNAAAGTPIGGSTLSPGGVGPVDPDFDNLLSAWMSPSTQNLPTPLSTYSTSPALYSSPFSDHLSTPAIDPIASFNSSGRSPDIVSASPVQPTFNLFDDLDSATSQSLFELMAHATAAQQLAAQDKAQASTSTVNGTSTVSPTDLGLGLATGVSRHASWENASSASSSLSPQSLDSRHLPTSPNSSVTSSRRDSKAPQPNGVRKNVQPRDLIPLDAPIQSRNYITPSATSRKDIPPSVARTFVPNSRKRSSQMAGLQSTEDMQDELAAEDDPAVVEEMNRRREMDPEKAALLEHVEQARRRNTLAARKSRQRKLEHVRTLEDEVDGLRAENEELKKGMEQKDMEIDQLQEKLRIAEEKLQASLGGVPSSS